MVTEYPRILHQVYKGEMSMENVTKSVNTLGVVQYELTQDDIVLSISMDDVNHMSVTQGGSTTKYRIGSCYRSGIPSNLNLSANALMSKVLYDGIFGE